MFHKATGKLFFFVVTLMFLALSFQNTWAFLNRTLPDATGAFLICMMIIFEGGFLGWLAMLMAGAENVWRVLISFVMLLITGTGVFVGAYYEIGGMMHKGLGYKIDPGVLTFVPTSVLLAYMATGIAVVLYLLASPEFFHRMRHMNTTGTAPALHYSLSPERPAASGQRPGFFARLGAALGGGQQEPASFEQSATTGQQAAAAKGPEHRICSECPAEFVLTNAKQLTCSPACRSKRARRLASQRKARTA